MLEAVVKTGLRAGENVLLALDVAASELWDKAAGRYQFRKSGDEARDAEGMIALYADWVRQYPIDLNRGWARRKRLGGLADADAGARWSGYSSWATTYS